MAVRGSSGLLAKALSIPEIGILISLAVLCSITSYLNPTFYSEANLVNLLRSISFTGLIAVFMTYVFVAGGLDLSVGSVAGLCGTVSGLAMQAGVSVLLSVLLGLLVGAVAGLVNGGVSVYLRVPAFIVTLGTMNIARGIIYILTEGEMVFPLPESFTRFGASTLLRMPYSVIILLVVAGIADFALRKTTYGRAVCAVGGNQEVAYLAGIRVRLVQLSTYLLVALASAAAGILLAARLGSASAAAGQGWELQAISAVILGGTSMFGGIGTIRGTLLGAATMAVLSNGMVLIGVSPYWQNVALGTIMVLAVGLDQLRRTKLGL
jgi:ribose/xylose/arabinose/galactoside ABC-type transport system permease subunit